jgi:1-acyl-sn-glycerol-3-phosphate acyltransferase
MGTRAFYWACTYLLRAILFVVARWEVVGVERLPSTGPVLLVANHLKAADPPLLGAAVPRRVVFMAKQELFRPPVIGLFARWYGAFPVRRTDADLKALRQAQETLRRGEVLGMFPEGTRSGGRGLGKGHPGSALIALRTGASIVPAGITGTEVVSLPGILWKIFTRPRITVVIGEPFQLQLNGRLTTEQVEQATDQIMRRIAALLPKEYQGVYRDEVIAAQAPSEQPAAVQKG